MLKWPIINPVARKGMTCCVTWEARPEPSLRREERLTRGTTCCILKNLILVVRDYEASILLNPLSSPGFLMGPMG